MSVRFATPEEWERVRDVRLRALADAPDAFGRTFAEERDASEADWRAFIEGWEGATNAMAVAESDGTWVGMALGSRTADEPEAHLYAMWVEPGRRRQGIGERLVDAVLGWARSWGARSVVLGVTETNEGAATFYRNLGFEDSGGRHPLRDGSDLTVLVLRRRL